MPGTQKLAPGKAKARVAIFRRAKDSRGGKLGFRSKQYRVK
jgi:hypothetical protein